MINFEAGGRCGKCTIGKDNKWHEDYSDVNEYRSEEDPGPLGVLVNKLRFL